MRPGGRLGSSVRALFSAPCNGADHVSRPPRRPSFGWRQLRELDDGEGFEASHGNLQLVLAHTAQGCDGDYDSGNPGDVPLMRHPFSGRSSPDAQWTELEDGDYLTDLSAGVPWRELVACTQYIFQKVVDDIMAQGGVLPWMPRRLGGW